MKRGLRIAVVFVAYLIALVIMAPATLVDAGVRNASNGRLRIAESGGTVWSGAGALELIDLHQKVGIARAVSWHLKPASLLIGHAVYEIQLADGAVTATLVLSPSRTQFENGVVELPASALAIGLPQLAAAQLKGDLAVNVQRFVADRSGVRASAKVMWRNAGSALTTVSPFGEYELQVESDEAGPRAALRTLKGPLQLEGHGSWPPRAPPAFSATAHVPPEHAEALAPLLRLVATESAPGVFQLALR